MSGGVPSFPMIAPSQPADYLQQLQTLNAVNTLDRDLWKSQNAQTGDLINHSDKINYANEYRGNRAFDYTNSHIRETENELKGLANKNNFENEYRGNRAFDYTNAHIREAATQGLAAVERNGTANLVAGERNAGFLNAQNERIASMIGNQVERVGATGVATTEKVGAALTTQAERIHNSLVEQNERIGTATFTQNERIGAAISTQGERIHNDLSTQNERIGAALGSQTERVAGQLSFQNERVGNNIGMQNERINNDIKGLLNQNFTQTLDGLHDIRARNTDNFAKTWVEQEKANTLSYRNTSDLARLALDHAGKSSAELQKVEMGLSKMAMEQANTAMRLNLEQFAKMQIDAAKTEAALSKQGSEQTFLLSRQIAGTEEKIIEKMSCIDKDRLRDKAYLGAARGLVLDEYHHRNFHAGQDPYWHHHGHHRHHSRSRSRSHSPRRRRGRRDDDEDTRINVITNIRDNNELDSRIRNRAGAIA